MRKPTIWVQTRSDTNQPAQSQKQARSLQFLIYEEEGCTIRVAKTKALISCAVTAQLICGFVFAYANCLCSYAVAQMFLILSLFVPGCISRFCVMSTGFTVFNWENF